MIVGNTFRDIPSPVKGCRGRDRMMGHLKLPIAIQSVHITIILRLNATHGEMNSIQHYVIKFVSDLQQVSCLSLGPPRYN